MRYRTGHIADHPAVVARRAGLHLHPDYGSMRAGTMPLRTNNRAKLPRSAGGPGLRNQFNIGGCFPAGTPILMADGTERAIEEVAQGNEVRTHNGKRRRVVETTKRLYDGPLYAVTVHGYVYPTTMTDEHPVAVMRNGHEQPKWNYSPGELAWVAARDLKPGDWVLLPTEDAQEDRAPITLRAADFIEEDVMEVDGTVRCISAPLSSRIPARIALDEGFARLLGLFLAEGSYRKSAGLPHGVTFSFGRHERAYQQDVVDQMHRIFGATAVVHDPKKRQTTTEVRASNETMAKLFLALCGEGALTKTLAPMFFESPRSIRIALLRGWLQGDGTQDALPAHRDALQVHGCTSSEALHRALFRLALSCGLKPGCQQRARESHQNAPSGSLYFYGEDLLAIFPEKREQALARGIETRDHRRHRKCPMGFVCKIRSIAVSQPEEPINVYNFEVDGEHTYVANCLAVHNCEGCANSSAGTLQFALDGTPLPEPISHIGSYLQALMCDAAPNLDGTLPWLIDTGTMPSSILGGWGLYGGSLESAWGQLPMSSATMSATAPGVPDGALIQPTPNQLYTGRACRLQGAYFLTSSGANLVRDIYRVHASGRVLTNAICGSSDVFQNYTGGVIGTLDGPIDHAQFFADSEWTSDQASLDAFMAGDDSLVKFYLGHGVNSWGGVGCPEGGDWGEVDSINLLGGQYRADANYAQQAQDWCVMNLQRVA